MFDILPSYRENFDIVIICVLLLESSTISLIFDQFWDKQGN